MKLIAAACASLAALCVLKTAGAQATSASPADSRRGKAEELYTQRCARCHGRDGRGKTKLGEIVNPPDFTDADWWKGGVSDARLRAAIADGKGEMPAFAKKLSRSEISALAAYVRAFAPDRREER